MLHKNGRCLYLYSNYSIIRIRRFSKIPFNFVTACYFNDPVKNEKVFVTKSLEARKIPNV